MACSAVRPTPLPDVLKAVQVKSCQIDRF